ncbi:MAG: RtcB family protein, partial [Myxococcota bacterium]
QQSLAHGAGRRWKRSEAKGRLKDRFSGSDLGRTPIGGRVICDNKDLLFEEAPQAYKAIEDVVQALVAAGVAEVVAVLSPVLTYKTQRR